jgi:hypothetical protein
LFIVRLLSCGASSAEEWSAAMLASRDLRRSDDRRLQRDVRDCDEGRVCARRGRVRVADQAIGGAREAGAGWPGEVTPS